MTAPPLQGRIRLDGLAGADAQLSEAFLGRHDADVVEGELRGRNVGLEGADDGASLRRNGEHGAAASEVAGQQLEGRGVWIVGFAAVEVDLTADQTQQSPREAADPGLVRRRERCQDLHGQCGTCADSSPAIGGPVGADAQAAATLRRARRQRQRTGHALEHHGRRGAHGERLKGERRQCLHLLRLAAHQLLLFGLVDAICPELQGASSCRPSSVLLWLLEALLCAELDEILEAIVARAAAPLVAALTLQRHAVDRCHA
mmetsp:Transcript_89273/g.255616  ORF Transcript_89273/g.255616 Transcript_89273/m.255616 type:complete len:259 (+) Transcript_89273:417-1193(+)